MTSTNPFRHVWIITAVAALYGLGNGAFQVSTPQAGLKLEMSSDQIGWLGAGISIGYTLGCLTFCRIFFSVKSKYVLLGGTTVSVIATAVMATSRRFEFSFAAQVAYGLSGGAFWPFASAWLLDFQADGISKARLLRHYNVAWTTGTALGLFVGGQLCAHKYIFETIAAVSVIDAAVLFIACMPRATHHSVKQEATGGSRLRPAIGLPLLIAAVLGNVGALATRAVINNNYPELNKLMHFDADRMGMFAAGILLSQLCAFAFGSLYEHYLGLRRVYFFVALSLAAINMAFASTTSLFILLPAVFLCGFVLAISFQTAIIAATGFFSSARMGTSFHESVIGFGGVASLAAGSLVAQMKAGGHDSGSALRAPFMYLSVIIVAALAVEIALISSRNSQRILLPAHS